MIDLTGCPLTGIFGICDGKYDGSLNQTLFTNPVSLTLGVVFGAYRLHHPRFAKSSHLPRLLMTSRRIIMGFGAVMASGCNI